MKAVTCHNSELELVELANPQPASGQVVIDVLGCGIGPGTRKKIAAGTR